MTVKHSKESAEDPMISCTDFQKLKELSSAPHFAMNTGDFQEFTDDDEARKFFSHQKMDRCFSDKLKRFIELERQNNESSEGSSSSDDFESPKSVDGTVDHEHRSFRFVHHQVRKIREEEIHLGEDIGEGLNTKDNKLAVIQFSSHHVGALIWSRPILPSSPLSGKTAIKSFH